jgi:hypothetical protein
MAGTLIRRFHAKSPLGQRFTILGTKINQEPGTANPPRGIKQKKPNKQPS